MYIMKINLNLNFLGRVKNKYSEKKTISSSAFEQDTFLLNQQLDMPNIDYIQLSKKRNKTEEEQKLYDKFIQILKQHFFATGTKKAFCEKFHCKKNEIDKLLEKLSIDPEQIKQQNNNNLIQQIEEYIKAGKGNVTDFCKEYNYDYKSISNLLYNSGICTGQIKDPKNNEEIFKSLTSHILDGGSLKSFCENNPSYNKYSMNKLLNNSQITIKDLKKQRETKIIEDLKAFVLRGGSVLGFCRKNKYSDKKIYQLIKKAGINLKELKQQRKDNLE